MCLLWHNNIVLKKELRLTEKYYINRVKRLGATLHGRFVILVFLPRGSEKKITVIVSKKFDNRAVKRNEIKRKIREVVRHGVDKYKSGLYIFIPKKQISNASYEEINTDINSVISKVS